MLASYIRVRTHRYHREGSIAVYKLDMTSAILLMYIIHVHGYHIHVYQRGIRGILFTMSEVSLCMLGISTHEWENTRNRYTVAILKEKTCC